MKNPSIELHQLYCGLKTYVDSLEMFTSSLKDVLEEDDNTPIQTINNWKIVNQTLINVVLSLNMIMNRVKEYPEHYDDISVMKDLSQKISLIYNR